MRTRNEKTKSVQAAVLAMTALLALHCGQTTGRIDGGTDTGSMTDAGGTGPCPPSLPTHGTACARSGLVCAYGDDPRPNCRPSATCTGGTWVVAMPNCPTLPPAMCPPSREAAAGQRCMPVGAYCSYDGVPCECTNCIRYPVERCEGDPTWHCAAPPADMRCPPGIPNLGTPCGMEGQQCVYGCEENMARTCRDGVWVASTAPGGCPISTRRAKRDIRYLSPEEIDALAEQVCATRLATYEYTDPALAGRRRLGFILEDQENSFAVDPEHSQVDLYGYTSMLVAAVQAQSRRIEALERQVARLRQASERTHRRR